MLLELGESVIINASWLPAQHRAAAAAVAEQPAVRLVQPRCAAPPSLAAQRMKNRRGDASGANPAIAAQMAAAPDPWPDAIMLDTSGTGSSGSLSQSAKPVRRALGAIRPHGPEHVWRPTHLYMLPG